jgi:hypothetical protein
MSAHCAPLAPDPARFTDWLALELDKKLASLPTEQARYRHLILCGNAWRLKYDMFVSFGQQPFNEPHPVYGDMDAFDFSLLLTMIDQRKARLENAKVTA